MNTNSSIFGNKDEEHELGFKRDRARFLFHFPVFVGMGLKVSMLFILKLKKGAKTCYLRNMM